MKGQAAIEFLMTYGWAIMAVLIMMGAMAYFGLLSPSAFLPERCDIIVGFSCVDFLVTTDKVTLDLVNGLGDTVTIKAISVVDPETALEVCRSAPDISLLNGARSGPLIVGCTIPLTDGIKKDLNVKITYAKIPAFQHVLAGNLYAYVTKESGSVTVPVGGGTSLPTTPTGPGSATPSGGINMPTNPTTPSSS